MDFVQGKTISGERPWVNDGHGKTRDGDAHFRERCLSIFLAYFLYKMMFSFENYDQDCLNIKFSLLYA